VQEGCPFEKGLRTCPSLRRQAPAFRHCRTRSLPAMTGIREPEEPERTHHVVRDQLEGQRQGLGSAQEPQEPPGPGTQPHRGHRRGTRCPRGHQKPQVDLPHRHQGYPAGHRQAEAGIAGRGCLQIQVSGQSRPTCGLLPCITVIIIDHSRVRRSHGLLRRCSEQPPKTDEHSKQADREAYGKPDHRHAQ